MVTELKSKDFIAFVMQGILVGALILSLVMSINFVVDASDVITAKTYTEMAKLALAGNTVAVPENYNERVYQVAIVDETKEIPETIVIGSSRGMFLGEDITGYNNLYNNCVSGACMEDYYALLGLYYQKFHSLPHRVIIETSPWVFFRDNPEARWTENARYQEAAAYLYKLINDVDLAANAEKENPLYPCHIFDIIYRL